MKLSPLYFSEKGGSMPKTSENNCALVPEIFGRVVTFASRGDLAKLASVQSSWSNIMYDSASHSAKSQWELAQALLKGTDGLESNPAAALRLLELLANVEIQNNVPTGLKNKNSCEYQSRAIMEIAQYYLDQPENYTLGLKWLEAGHTMGGLAEAAHELAVAYEEGRYGVSSDVEVAAEWLHKAAEAGHVESMAELGLIYELGCSGVPQSDETALEWYRKAAENGHLTSLYSIGEMYEEARGGVILSEVEACRYYFQAARKGDEDSKRALRRLQETAVIVLPAEVRLLLNA